MKILAIIETHQKFNIRQAASSSKEVKNKKNKKYSKQIRFKLAISY